jgi:mycothiol synthase
MAAPAGVAFRPLAASEFAAVAALLAADEAHGTGRPSRLAAADLRSWLAGVDLAVDTWVFAEDGRPLAFGWHETHPQLAFAAGVVHPEARGRGLGTALVETAERRAAEAGSKRLHYGVLAADAGAPALLTAHGFREVRRFYELAIELDGPPPPPSLADGLVLDIFTEADARPFFDAVNEAFQDHWEHHSRPFDEWWALQRSSPDFDPTLWFVVRDGNELAAVVRNEPNRNGGGYVAVIGVRRAWRGRGLGRALLLRSFGEFHHRGVNRITLGVDAENPTGATQLYESVGMTPELEQVVFEKALS